LVLAAQHIPRVQESMTEKTTPTSPNSTPNHALDPAADALPAHDAAPALILPLRDADATARLGAALAKWVGPGDVIALWGDLGAGKTSFARALIQAKLAAHGHSEDVPSPTFTLVQTYETPDVEIWHVDLYRITHADEVVELGVEDAMVDSLVLIEWPGRMGEDLPADRLDVFFDQPNISPSTQASETTSDLPGRVAKLWIGPKGHTRWAPRLEKLATFSV
jgi:tRNA threonylcarbamoyladenosine biosynthesis protein TsaE